MSAYILVVDDEPSIAKYMGLVLGREGFEVLTAFNAEEGWELFQRQVPPARAVVTNLVDLRTEKCLMRSGKVPVPC